MASRAAIVFLAALPLVGTSCTFISKSDEFSGLTGQQGKPVSFYSATRIGVNLLFFIPLIGDVTVTRAIKDMTEKVKDEGGTNVRLIQTGGTVFWFLLPPVTFIIHPALTYCSGDAEFEGPAKPVEASKG